MKFPESVNRRGGHGGGGRGGPPDDVILARNRIKFLKQQWPHKSGLTTFSPTDEELQKMLLENSADYVRAGRVTAEDPDRIYTVQRFGWPCIANGWSIVPQDREGNRKPSRIPYTVGTGRSSKVLYDQYYPTKWRERRQNIREFLHYADVFDVNLALQCCAASGHIRILDIDCRDEAMAEDVKRIAFEQLGVTPFVRYGARPKVQLVYRVQGAGIAIGRWSITFKNPDGTPDVDEDGHPNNAVELLAEGGIFTAYGRHHRTGFSFEWESLHPAIARPELSPLVTKAMLRAFTNALQVLRPITGGVANSNPHGGKSIITEFDRRGNGRIWVPKIAQGQWTVDADGYVTDGAESWTTAHAWALCAANAGDLRRLMPIIEDYLTAHAVNVLGKRHRDNGGYSSDDRIMRTVRQKLQVAADKWYSSIDSFLRTGRYDAKIVPWGINEDGTRPVPQRIAPATRPADGSLDWIPDDQCPVEALADSMPTARVSIVRKDADKVAFDAWARVLEENLDERHAIAARLSGSVRGHVGAFFANLVKVPFDLLKAPTGAGKTVAFWAEVAAYLKKNRRWQNGQDAGPILFVVPSHANEDESMKVAQREGLWSGEFWTEDEIDSVQAMIGPGAKVVRFKGRAAEGMCQRRDELKMLSDKGIGASGLCGKTVDAVTEQLAKAQRRDGEEVEQIELLCPFREAGECAYYNQFDDLMNADVIVVTHAYLTLHTLPKALKNPRAVIIDESVTYAAIEQGRLPLDVFELGRKQPYVTKKDRLKNPDWTIEQIKYGMWQDRLEAAAIAKQAVLDGKDLAKVFEQHRRGRELVDAAIVVCERSHDADREVRPDLSPEAVADIAGKKMARHLLLEKRVWTTIRDRLDAIQNGTACGYKDMRFQRVMHLDAETGVVGPHLRVSWRRKLNWADRPILLLDASANKRIMGKVFGTMPDEHIVDAPLHVRTVASIEKTWSTSSFIPAWDASDEEKARCAANIASARALITITSVVYGYGRVLIGTTMKVREVLTGGGWLPPANCDFVHFGALRGLDFAKHHVCAISIGRSEQPIGIIDGYAAALTYDDEFPEEPYDRSGEGLTPEGRPLFRKATPRTMLMRTGQDVSHNVPEMPGKMVMTESGEVVLVTELVDGKKRAVRSWAQDLEESWREEELRQFLGRLRPVFRGVAVDADGIPIDVEPPVWLFIGKVQPAGIVIDEVVEVAQLIKPAPVYDMIRLADGVFDEHVMPSVPAVSDMMRGRSLQEFRKEFLPHRDGYVRRLISSMTKIVYRMANDEIGRERPAFVAGAWVEGDAGEYWKAMAEANGVGDVVVVRVEPSARQPTGVVSARADKVDARLPSREERREAELTVRAIASRAKLSPAVTEIKLLAGERVAGIKLDEPEPEYIPEIEERYTRDLPKTTFEEFWGGHGQTIGGVPIDG